MTSEEQTTAETDLKRCIKKSSLVIDLMKKTKFIAKCKKENFNPLTYIFKNSFKFYDRDIKKIIKLAKLNNFPINSKSVIQDFFFHKKMQLNPYFSETVEVFSNLNFVVEKQDILWAADKIKKEIRNIGNSDAIVHHNYLNLAAEYLRKNQVEPELLFKILHISNKKRDDEIFEIKCFHEKNEMVINLSYLRSLFTFYKIKIDLKDIKIDFMFDVNNDPSDFPHKSFDAIIKIIAILLKNGLSPNSTLTYKNKEKETIFNIYNQDPSKYYPLEDCFLNMVSTEEFNL